MTRVPLVSRPSRLFAASALVVGVMSAVAVVATQQATPKPASPKPTQAPSAMASATPPAAPVFVRLAIVELRPDMLSEYVALQKSDTIPGLQKGGVPWRNAWRTGNFGSSFTVAYITPLKSFATLDEPNPLMKAMGEEAYQQYLAKMAKLITSQRVYALRDRPDLGLKTEGTPMAKLGVLASVEVVPGRATEFETILKTEWTPALKKAGVPNYGVSQVIFGGSAGQYYTFTPIENYAQLDAGHPIVKSIGEAGMNRIMAKLGNSTRSVERFIIRYDEELSFKTQQTSEVR
jgi:hypothetical protein